MAAACGKDIADDQDKKRFINTARAKMPVINPVFLPPEIHPHGFCGEWIGGHSNAAASMAHTGG